MTDVQEAASAQEREEAQARIRGLVWDELQRVVTAIQVEKALGVEVSLAIRFDKWGHGGPRLVVDEQNLEGFALAKLSELAGQNLELEVVGQNLELEVVGGKLELSSASWPPDRIPF